jgi:membrane dipeptidase
LPGIFVQISIPLPNQLPGKIMSSRAFGTTLYFALGLSFSFAQENADTLRARAEKLSKECIIVDTHIDTPEQMRDNWQDISKRIPKGDFDYPRAKEGGLTAPFMAIYIPAEEERAGTARRTADMLIDMVNKFASDWPDKFAIATSPDEVRTNFREGKISLCLGLENGAPIEKNEDVAYFFKRGIRYVTLTHALDNHISDSSFDTTRTWHGLSPFGKRLISELNKAGIMVDVSHITDDAFTQVMEISKAPVIASHSSCRFFTPGFERNMSDDMIKLLAKNGGVIQINFGSEFLSQRCREESAAFQKAIREYLHSHQWSYRDSAAQAFIREYHEKHPVAHADVSDVVAHIDHVVRLVGVDHVGIGSDFDGVGDSLPVGLEDVSKYPNLIYGLLKAGYSVADIRKICGENLLRVWSEVQKIGSDSSAHE